MKSIAQEHYNTENEMRDELTESYGMIQCGHLEIEAGRLFQEFDVPFFDACIAESLKYECPYCEKLYDDEDSANECCAEWCGNCGARTDELFVNEFGIQCTCNDSEGEQS